MTEHAPLMATIVGALVLAFVLGAVANRLRISPLVGYLLAGVVAGPYTPGFVADQAVANQLAEIGVILLMFGVGLHFSFKDLLAVRTIAVPGALIRILFATGMGMMLAWVLGWSPGGGFVFGLALSVTSTVVLLRTLQERHLLQTEWGRVAVGWMVVEDLAMVLTLVLLPAMAALARGEAQAQEATVLGLPRIVATATLTIGKVAAFVTLMLLVGRRVIPWILHYMAHMGSRELFRLAVLAIALGVAYGAAGLFDVSFALGAFFAGMMLAESELSQQAANETLPLRDAFAVLFFVSVGMLFDPGILVDDLAALIGTVFIIVIGKSIIAFLIVRAFGQPVATALPIAVSLSQIGEFSFILAALGVALGVLPERGRDLVLAGAIIAILANPALFAALDRLRPRLGRWLGAPGEKAAPELPKPEPLPVTGLKDHAVLAGYGRVGSALGAALEAHGLPFFVIEDSVKRVEDLRSRGIEALAGNAAVPEILRAANVAGARLLFVAIPNAFECGQIVEQVRAANPATTIIARAHLDAEVDYLKNLGADIVIMGEREIARAMFEQACLKELVPRTA